jgi:hypothetical protein
MPNENQFDHLSAESVEDRMAQQTSEESFYGESYPAEPADFQELKWAILPRGL